VLTGAMVVLAFLQLASQPPRWRWFVECADGATTRLHVTLRRRTLLDVTVPVCVVPEHQRSREAEERVLEFHFKGDPAWFDLEHRSSPGTAIEGNIWQAGGETYGMLLGVSFVETGGAGRILLNTIHISMVTEHSSAPVAVGIDVSTSRYRRTTARRAERPSGATGRARAVQQRVAADEGPLPSKGARGASLRAAPHERH
jgi:hypothetical protein